MGGIIVGFVFFCGYGFDFFCGLIWKEISVVIIIKNF